METFKINTSWKILFKVIDDTCVFLHGDATPSLLQSYSKFCHRNLKSRFLYSGKPRKRIHGAELRKV